MVDGGVLMPTTTTVLRDDAEMTVTLIIETDAQGKVIATSQEAVPKPGTPLANATLLRQRAVAGLATNSTFLATVAARRTSIANGKSTAQTGTTATVGNIAAAQTQIRSIWTVLVQVATALDDLNNQAETTAKECSGVIRLLLSQLDSIADT